MRLNLFQIKVALNSEYSKAIINYLFQVLYTEVECINSKAEYVFFL